MAVKQTRTACVSCHARCGAIVTSDGDKILKIEGDPENPKSRGAFCSTGISQREIHEDVENRIIYPMKRVGPRGSGEWERISWDEAMTDIAERLQSLRDTYGAETLATAIGGPHATFWPLHRFLSLFGTPNNMGIGQICWNPRIWMDAITFGWTIEPALSNATSGLFLWGTNPAESDNSLFWRAIRDMSRAGTPVVVVDSRLTRTAKVASLWLAPKPGTDTTLALGLIREVIEQGGVDTEFVERWCHGYDELAAHVAPYTPEVVERICGVSADDLRAAAAIWASHKPVALISGRGIDQLGPNTYPVHRAICCLRAITGNFDRDGACHLHTKSTFIPEVDLEFSDRLAPEQRAKSLNEGVITLQTWEGWEAISELTRKVGGNRLPARYLASVHPGRVWNAAVTGDPYPVRALIAMGCNVPLIQTKPGEETEAKISQMNMAVADLCMLPDTQFIDISSYYESDPAYYEDQDTFVNAVALIRTGIAPHELLGYLHAIENSLGRVRSIPNGPRTCDLDILDYQLYVSDDEVLTLPHPRICERDFVVKPLLEILPGHVLSDGTVVTDENVVVGSARKVNA